MAFIKSFKGVNYEPLLKTIEELIVMNKVNSKFSDMDDYSGLSLLAMQNTYLEQIDKYKHLIFFKTFDTKNFYKQSVILFKK